MVEVSLWSSGLSVGIPEKLPVAVLTSTAAAIAANAGIISRTIFFMFA